MADSISSLISVNTEIKVTVEYLVLRTSSAAHDGKIAIIFDCVFVINKAQADFFMLFMRIAACAPQGGQAAWVRWQNAASAVLVAVTELANICLIQLLTAFASVC